MCMVQRKAILGWTVGEVVSVLSLLVIVVGFGAYAGKLENRVSNSEHRADNIESRQITLEKKIDQVLFTVINIQKQNDTQPTQLQP